MSKANEPRRNPLGLLLRHLGSDEACIRRRPGAAEDFQALLNAGFLSPDGLLSSIICDECGEQEPVSVVSLGGRIGIRCRVEGFVERDPESLAAFRLEREGFARALRVVLAGSSETSPPLKRISDHLWRLGGFRFQEVRWVGFLVLRLRRAEDFAEIGKEIMALSGSSPAAVFTASRDVESWPSLPKGGRFVSLPEVFALSVKGLIETDEAALSDGLGLPLPQPQSSGRPSLKRDPCSDRRTLPEGGLAFQQERQNRSD